MIIKLYKKNIKDQTTDQLSPRLAAHLVLLMRETDGSLALDAGVLDRHLKVVRRPASGNRTIRLNYTNVVPVVLATDVRHRKLVLRHNVEEPRAIAGVEMGWNLLLVKLLQERVPLRPRPPASRQLENVYPAVSVDEIHLSPRFLGTAVHH